MGKLIIKTYAVSRTSSQTKFNSFSFIEGLKFSNPSAASFKESKPIVFATLGDSEMNSLRKLNHASVPSVQVNVEDLE